MDSYATDTELSKDALVALLYEVWSFRDVQFQIWLLITIAVIVAIYVSAPTLTRILRYLVGATYFVSSVVMTTGWLMLERHAGHYVRILGEKHQHELPVPFPWVATATVGLMVILTIGVTCYILLYHREKKT